MSWQQDLAAVVGSDPTPRHEVFPTDDTAFDDVNYDWVLPDRSWMSATLTCLRLTADGVICLAAINQPRNNQPIHLLIDRR